MGWDAITNGELIRLAEADFDVFVTSDQNIRYQQNLSGRRIAIFELSTNDLRRILSAAASIKAKQVAAVTPYHGKPSIRRNGVSETGVGEPVPWIL
jgi:hypothetical protein